MIFKEKLTQYGEKSADYAVRYSIRTGSYNDGVVKPPLYYYRDTDKNEVDLLIENGDYLHPVEIKTTSDPTTFRCLDKIPVKKKGLGAIVCLAKERLVLTEDIWILPVGGI